MQIEVGFKFGDWVVQDSNPIHTPGRSKKLHCMCQLCGKHRNVALYTLKTGASKSCGCNRMLVHGAARRGQPVSREWRSWRSMHDRCFNVNSPSYPHYGGAGIKVADEWRDFSTFLKDVGPRPENTSLDRIDNEKGYFPGNVRWATPRQQVENRKITWKVYDEFGFKFNSLREASEFHGISRNAIKYRALTPSSAGIKFYRQTPVSS